MNDAIPTYQEVLRVIEGMTLEPATPADATMGLIYTFAHNALGECKGAACHWNDYNLRRFRDAESWLEKTGQSRTDTPDEPAS